MYVAWTGFEQRSHANEQIRASQVFAQDDIRIERNEVRRAEVGRSVQLDRHLETLARHVTTIVQDREVLFLIDNNDRQ
jgi:hypothetical protein